MVTKEQCVKNETKLIVDRITATDKEWDKIGKITIQLQVGEIVTFQDSVNNNSINVGFQVIDSKGKIKGWYPAVIFSLQNKIHEIW